MTRKQLLRFTPIGTKVEAEEESLILRLISKYPIIFFSLLVAAVVKLWWDFDAGIPTAKDKLEQSGQFGDSFGKLNTLFSGLAFAAIVAALFLQRLDVSNTLKSVRQQLKLAQLAQANNTEAIARFFDTAEMREVRATAHEIRVLFMSADFDRSSWAMHWVNSCNVKDEFSDPIFIRRMRATSRLIEYYSSLLHHLKNLNPSDQAKLAPNLTQRYYWQFWRGYLLGLSRIVHQVYCGEIGTKGKQYPLPTWIADLRTLDGVCGMEAYNPLQHPVDKWNRLALFEVFGIRDAAMDDGKSFPSRVRSSADQAPVNQT